MPQYRNDTRSGAALENKHLEEAQDDHVPAPRLALVVPTLFFVSVLIFGLQQLLPGDPALALAGEDRNPEVIAFLRQKYHFDEPLPVRYLLWVEGVFAGDLGNPSDQAAGVRSGARKLPVTGELAAIAFVIALSIGVPIGVVSAVKNGSLIDYAATMAALWGLSIPNFWLGILLILLFSVEWGLLPASGFVSPAESLSRNLGTLIMPAFVLGNALAAGMMRHTRSAMLGVLSADYVRTARAKGLSETRVVLHHALRNALVPLITLGALDFGALLSGAVLTEQVFTIPGFGKLIVDAVFNRDYAVVQGSCCARPLPHPPQSAADVAYVLVNPRLRDDH
jgi:peptide/nickel transport system permease protein